MDNGKPHAYCGNVAPTENLIVATEKHKQLNYTSLINEFNYVKKITILICYPAVSD